MRRPAWSHVESGGRRGGARRPGHGHGLRRSQEGNEGNGGRVRPRGPEHPASDSHLRIHHLRAAPPLEGAHLPETHHPGVGRGGQVGRARGGPRRPGAGPRRPRRSPGPEAHPGGVNRSEAGCEIRGDRAVLRSPGGARQGGASRNSALDAGLKIRYDYGVISTLSRRPKDMMTEAEKQGVLRDILKLKKERQAVILAHNYQRGELQDLADFTGDSLGLTQQAAKTDAKVIVFCGVHFMAETAAIMNPDKIVVIPDKEAGCSLAAMISGESLRRWKAEHPGAVVVSYIKD